MLQKLKYFLRDQLGLPPWAILVAVGCLAHLLLNTMLRKPVTSPWGLLGPFSLGIAIESWEIWLQYRSIGLFAPENDALLTILGRHGLDVALLLGGPLLIVLIGIIFSR